MNWRSILSLGQLQFNGTELLRRIVFFLLIFPYINNGRYKRYATSKVFQDFRMIEQKTMKTYTNLSSKGYMARWKILACTIAMCGIQVCYAAQINMGTAQLLFLGLSERTVALAWLAGPLSGLIVQPIVGIASDSCTSKLGRRRPFLIAGAIFTSAALLIFSNALEISKAISPQLYSNRIALTIAIFSFFLLDFSIQAVQAPLRALVTDIVPTQQRASANAYVGIFTGLGNLLGGFLTSIDLKRYFKFFSTDVQALFGSAAAVLITTVAVSVITTDEVPLHIESDDNENRIGSNSHAENERFTSSVEAGMDSIDRDLYSSIRNTPQPFWPVFCVQLCTWCGFFSLFVYVNAWVGRNVYLGDETFPPGTHKRELFERGIRLGGKGNAITAIVTLVYSAFLPVLMQRFGTVKVYAFSQLVEAVSLLSAPLIRGNLQQHEPSRFLKLLTLTDIGSFGIVWATTMTVPWTLIGDALESDSWYRKRIGLFTTLFNASQSFPQLVVALVSPFILSMTGDNPAFVMFSGGVCALLGIFFVLTLPLGVSERVNTLAAEKVSEYAPLVQNLYGRFSDVIHPADFENIFRKNFRTENEISRHAQQTASWLA